MTIHLSIPRDFRLRPTVYSHGWCSLPPFEVKNDELLLFRIYTLAGGKVVPSVITQPRIGSLSIECSDQRLSPSEQRELEAQVRTCLRLDDDLREFYREAKRHPKYRWIPKTGAGRMLRAPTVFEDVVKMMCTTNCSWALTEIMVGNLTRKLGCKVHETRYTFPTPEAIADSSEKFLRKEIRAGYRSPYLLELSRRIAKGQLDIESWRTSILPTEELFDEVRSAKGIGPYAAGNILKLLGRYDYLGIDSWCRKKFCELHTKRGRLSDKSIERHYRSYGKWRGLFFWLDVTKYWYNEKFPF